MYPYFADFQEWTMFHCIDAPHLYSKPLIKGTASVLLHNYAQCRYEHSSRSICTSMFSIWELCAKQKKYWIIYNSMFHSLLRDQHVFFKVTAPAYAPNSNVQDSQFLYFLTNIYYCPSFDSISILAIEVIDSSM